MNDDIPNILNLMTIQNRDFIKLNQDLFEVIQLLEARVTKLESDKHEGGNVDRKTQAQIRKRKLYRVMDKIDESLFEWISLLVIVVGLFILLLNY